MVDCWSEEREMEVVTKVVCNHNNNDDDDGGECFWFIVILLPLHPCAPEEQCPVDEFKYQCLSEGFEFQWRYNISHGKETSGIREGG